jgi:hypothetical protein
MGEMLPDRVPGEPTWLAGARIVLVALMAGSATAANALGTSWR